MVLYIKNILNRYLLFFSPYMLTMTIFVLSIYMINMSDMLEKSREHIFNVLSPKKYEISLGLLVYILYPCPMQRFPFI